SMSRRGNCHDNAPVESFFGLLKRERIRRLTYPTKDAVIRPGFPRHLKAMENGRFGGVYEQQAVYG
ncbi:hypothetical protein JWH08_00060, partial [Xanthomonas campestris pv. campestris]|nr:hypothetical protein [Xanthomonas campestris pv. campestris]MCD0252316.1 hypothetical protein [Xanthomonas campestris pv. campestris]MCD0260602.1 hypothetical protein [Xanthomonas campestris pv. campestris]MCD0268878.1 hypothetical protein [Xanthomonas campestris pv. campestris]